MARKRDELTAAQTKRLTDLLARGRTIVDIAADLNARGATASRATIARRCREIRGRDERKRPPRKAAASPPAESTDLPSSDDDIHGASIETLRRWIKNADQVGEEALRERNMRAWGEAGRLVKSLLDEDRKRQAPPKADPNEDPDLRAIAIDVAKRLHDYVDKIATLRDQGVE